MVSTEAAEKGADGAKTNANSHTLERAMRAQCLIFGSPYGEEHIDQRPLQAKYLIQIDYSCAELFTPSLIDQAWGEMFHSYQGNIGEGVRTMLQVGRNGITRGGLKEMALMPGPHIMPEWSYPNTFNMATDEG